MGRKFNRRTALVMATAMGVGGPALGLALTTATASAESGRRTCVYSRVIAKNLDGSDGIQYTVLVDYKKSGACPSVDAAKFKNVTGIDLQGPQPVGKITCENAANLISKNPWGPADICTQMIDDYVYKLTYDPATDQTRWLNYGSARSSAFAPSVPAAAPVTPTPP